MFTKECIPQSHNHSVNSETWFVRYGDIYNVVVETTIQHIEHHGQFVYISDMEITAKQPP